MEAVKEFLAMGGYGHFVWPAYLIAGAVLAILVGLSLRELRQQESTLQSLRSQRRGGQEDEVEL